jgi:hypothetical protein
VRGACRSGARLSANVRRAWVSNDKGRIRSLRRIQVFNRVLLTSIALVAIGFGAMSCASQRWPQLQAIPRAVKPTIPTNERECRQRRGNWSQQGLGGGLFVCDLQAGDARKICTDSAQCEGECLVASDLALATRAIGSCSDYLRTYGCHKFLRDNMVQSACTD